MRSNDRRPVSIHSLAARLAIATCAALLALVGFSARDAQARGFVGGGGAVFIPYDGEVGWNVYGEVGGYAWGTKGHFLSSGEFEFRRGAGNPTSGNVEDVNYDMYTLRWIGRFVFNPGHFTPYIGGGGGVSAINTKDTISRPGDLGMGLGVLGLAGLEAPFGNRFSIYSEVRFGYTWDVVGSFGNVKRSGMDGFSGVGGVRFWW